MANVKVTGKVGLLIQLLTDGHPNGQPYSLALLAFPWPAPRPLCMFLSCCCAVQELIASHRKLPDEENYKEAMASAFKAWSSPPISALSSLRLLFDPSLLNAGLLADRKNNARLVSD